MAVPSPTFPPTSTPTRPFIPDPELEPATTSTSTRADPEFKLGFDFEFEFEVEVVFEFKFDLGVVFVFGLEVVFVFDPTPASPNLTPPTSQRHSQIPTPANWRGPMMSTQLDWISLSLCGG